MAKAARSKLSTPRPAKAARADRKKGLQLTRAARQDDWGSVSTGLGTIARDKRQTYEVLAAYRWARSELLELYRGDPVVARIVDDRAKEMLRKGFTLTIAGDDDGEQAREVMDAIDDARGGDDAGASMQLPNKLFDWIRFGRLFGGCALYMGVNDGRDPSEPINWEGIESFDFLNVIDRYSIRPYSYYSGRLLPNFGQVYQYQVEDGLSFGTAPPKDEAPRKRAWQLVHSSRIIRFDAVRLLPEDAQFNWGWGDSVMTRIRQVVRDDGILWDSLAILMQEYSTAVVKMKGLAEALQSGDGKAIVQARMEGVQLARSIARLTVLDGGDESGVGGEEWGRDTISLSGVADVIDRFMQRVAMAADMPMTRLWGMSPAGLNATGQSDQNNYYDSIEGDQETILVPALHQLVRAFLCAKNGPTGGKEPDKWTVKCNPLKTMSPLEQAQLEKTVAEKDKVYIDAQVLDPREVAQSRYGGPEYSTQTQLDDEVRALMEESIDVQTEAANESAKNAAKAAGEKPAEKGPNAAPPAKK